MMDDCEKEQLLDDNNELIELVDKMCQSEDGFITQSFDFGCFFDRVYPRIIPPHVEKSLDRQIFLEINTELTQIKSSKKELISLNQKSKYVCLYCLKCWLINHRNEYNCQFILEWTLTVIVLLVTFFGIVIKHNILLYFALIVLFLAGIIISKYIRMF